jgi:hypothetical protein
MKLVVMLLTFQHLLLLGVDAQDYNSSGPCDGISPFDTQDSNN